MSAARNRLTGAAAEARRAGILRLQAEGLTQREIGRQLGIGHKSVGYHIVKAEGRSVTLQECRRLVLPTIEQRGRANGESVALLEQAIAQRAAALQAVHDAQAEYRRLTDELRRHAKRVRAEAGRRRRHKPKQRKT